MNNHNEMLQDLAKINSFDILAVNDNKFIAIDLNMNMYCIVNYVEVNSKYIINKEKDIKYFYDFKEATQSILKGLKCHQKKQ